MRVDALDDLTVELQYETQYAVRRRVLGPEIEGEIAQMSFGHGGLASAAGSTPAADTGSSLFDNDRGRHSSPIVIGAPRSKQSGVLCNEIDVGCLSWLQ